MNTRNTKYIDNLFNAKSEIFHSLLAILLMLLTACGGSNGDSPSPTTPIQNIAPVADAGSDQTVDSQAIVTLDASISSDSDGTVVSYLWSQTSGSTVTLNDTSSVTPTFTAPSLTVLESLIFQVLVTDNDGATASASVTITVNRFNVAPVADAGSDQSVDEQTQVSLDASGSSDSDGSIESLLWTQTAGLIVTLDDPNISAPVFAAPDVDSVETVSFELTVTDNDGATDTAVVNVTINPVEENAVPASELETSLALNQLFFEYTDRIGEKVWVLGFFGNLRINDDGAAFLVDNMLHLDVDEVLHHHSFARLDGLLPPEDWQGNLVLVYGEISDYATVSGTTTIQPTPLITVEKFEFINAFEQQNSWTNTLLSPDVAPENVQSSQKGKLESSLLSSTDFYSPQKLNTMNNINKKIAGTQAQDCDRVVIISGGVDESNNHARYRDNVVAKYNKMKEFGFTDDQIEIFYNNGTAINVNGVNVVDEKSDRAKITEHFEQLAASMPASCTLSVFVTDHGTGYNPAKGYAGARPALTGVESTTGALYDENTFIFDARAKTYRATASFVFRRNKWFFTKDGEGNMRIYKWEGSAWKFKGTNANGDDIISETELGGEDLNGDGDATDSDYGLPVSVLEARLVGDRKFQSNSWDTDGDGTTDVRLRHDGSRFVVERLDGGEWKEMGRDTNGDFFIDIIDGGVDWNLDGDKADQIGFHEGINLWGSEVLWDDEFANTIKPLSDKGIHTMMEMVSCFSGGFIPNLEGLVENIYTGSSEETPHYNRKNAEEKYFATDEISFLDNLEGIDTDSWNVAADAATVADDVLAVAQGATKNIHVHAQTPRFDTASIYESTSVANEYLIQLDLPDELIGEIYDYEFIFGLQKPRWTDVTFPSGLPTDQQTEEAPGGIRVFSDNPIADEQILTINASGIVLTAEDQIRIEYTDINHVRVGYTMVNSGDVMPPASEIEFKEPKICVNHTDHGQSSPSIVEWLLLAQILDNPLPLTEVRITVRITSSSGAEIEDVVLNSSGQLYLLYQIAAFGMYQLEIIGAIHVPSDEALQLVGQLLFPFEVTSEETNKGECAPN